MKFVFTILTLLFLNNHAFAYTNIPQNKAIVRALNKQTSRTNDIEIPVGTNTIFENILIHAHACYTRPKDETPENTAFFKITEVPKNSSDEINSVKHNETIFSGWMFSSSPSVVGVEHPNYDIWLLECINDNTIPKINTLQHNNY